MELLEEAEVVVDKEEDRDPVVVHLHLRSGIWRSRRTPKTMRVEMKEAEVLVVLMQLPVVIRMYPRVFLERTQIGAEINQRICQSTAAEEEEWAVVRGSRCLSRKIITSGRCIMHSLWRAVRRGVARRQLLRLLLLN